MQSQNKLFTKVSLRFVLIVPFVIQIALVVGLVGYLSFRNGQQAVNDVAHQLRSEIIARIEEHLHEFLVTPHQINEINANAIRQGSLDANDPKALERYLWEQIQVFDSVTSVYFGNTEGGLVDAGREGAEGSLYVIVTDGFTSGPFRKYATDSQGSRTELLTTLPDFDARTRPWYIGAVEKADATWSDTYILFTGHDMAISASRPVYDARMNLLGVVSSDIFVSHLGDFMTDLKIGETGSSFIMERSGLLVASSTDEPPFTDQDGDETQRRLHASESAIPTIRYAAKSLTERLGDYHNIIEEQQFEFEIDGRRQFLQVAPVHDEHGIDWLIVVVIPESDFMVQINAGNRTTAFLVGIALIIAVALGIITAQWITRPILHLNASTQALARGEWDQTISVAWIDEIGELARSFNSMVGQLKQTVESLTLEVAERKRVEEALRESEEQFRETVELLPEVVYECDAQGNLTYVNRAAFEKFGYTQEDFDAGVNVLQFVVPDDRKTVGVNIEAIVRGAGRGPSEYTAQRKDGSEFPVIIHSSPIIRDGSPVGLRGIIVDITERKRAEEDGERSRSLLKAALESTADGILVVAMDGVWSSFNQKFIDMWGIPALICESGDDQAALERIFGNLAAPEEFMARVIELYDEPERESSDTIELKDGRIFERYSQPQWLGEEIIGRVWSFRDTTERKQAERALEASEQKLRLMIDNSPIGFSVTDLKGNYIEVNPALCSMVGYTHEEMLHTHYDRITHPESRAVNAELYGKLVEGETPYFELEKAYIHKNGKIVHALLSAQLVRNSEGAPLFEFAMVEDITERKRAAAERNLLLSEIHGQAQQLAEVMSTVPEGVLLLDAAGRVILANPVAEGNLAFLTDAKMGDIITHLGDRPLAELLTSPPSQGLWHEVTADDRTFETVARPMGNGPEPEEWVLVLRDVTQERESERRTQQQARLAAVGQLAAGIAHDFNNIMAVIVLYTQIGLRLPDIPDQLRDRLQVVDQQAKRATDLIQQILDFSRRAVLERRPMDLTPFLKEVVRLLERTVPESIKMEFTFGRDEYMVNADPTRVQQVVMNLVVNARDAMLPKGGGELHVVLSRVAAIDEVRCVTCGQVFEGEWVRIAVTDTGEGISPDVLPHIFEPFYTTKEVGKGTGLGLAQVYGIVKQHAGHIDVTTKVGEGTTFTLYLPALPAHQPESPAEETRTSIRGQGETILVVEDHAILREALAASVELLNYRVLEAVDGREALELLEQGGSEIALVLSDMVMPEMGGAALFHAMRQRGLTLPMVMLSGHPMEREMESLREEGLAGWMLKPPNMVRLSQLLAEALK